MGAPHYETSQRTFLQDLLTVTFLILQFHFQLFTDTVTVMIEHIFKHYAVV